MKKALILTFTILFTAAVVFGCTPAKNQPVNTTPTPGGQPNGNQGITVNKIGFEVLDPEKLPKDKASLIEQTKENRGYLYWQDGEGYVIAIFSGQKPSAGYTIAVKSVEDNEGRTVIVVEEGAPSGPAATVITYPYIVIRAKGITDNFQIADTEGNAFEYLGGTPGADSSDAAQITTGLYTGRIDTNSIEVKLEDGSVKAFMITEVIGAFDNLKDNTNIRFVYYTNGYGQNIITDMIK